MQNVDISALLTLPNLVCVYMNNTTMTNESDLTALRNKGVKINPEPPIAIAP
jgi:hypothetical protein